MSRHFHFQSCGASPFRAAVAGKARARRARCAISVGRGRDRIEAALTASGVRAVAASKTHSPDRASRGPVCGTPLTTVPGVSGAPQQGRRALEAHPRPACARSAASVLGGL